MKSFAGLDVSLEETAICVVDEAGAMVREARIPSEPEPAKERSQDLRLARDAGFPHDPAKLVDHADRGLVQRHVQSGEVLHGCSSSMLVADAHGPRSIILAGAATPVGSPNHSICLSEITWREPALG